MVADLAPQRVLKQLFKDGEDRPVLLAKNEWALNNIKEKFPDVELLSVAPLG